MPKQKIRSSSRRPTHYNVNAGVIQGEARKALQTARGVSKQGEYKVKEMSKYLGSMITPENRFEFERNQKKLYKQNYLDKVEEEERGSEEQIERMASDYARYQSNKEIKHFKAWLMGKDVYSYRGTRFPVLTESLLKETSSVKEIVNIEAHDRKGEGGDSSGVHEDSEGGDGQTIRPDAGTQEDTQP